MVWELWLSLFQLFKRKPVSISTEYKISAAHHPTPIICQFSSSPYFSTGNRTAVRMVTPILKSHCFKSCTIRAGPVLLKLLNGSMNCTSPKFPNDPLLHQLYFCISKSHMQWVLMQRRAITPTFELLHPYMGLKSFKSETLQNILHYNSREDRYSLWCIVVFFLQFSYVR